MSLWHIKECISAAVAYLHNKNRAKDVHDSLPTKEPSSFANTNHKYATTVDGNNDL